MKRTVIMVAALTLSACATGYDVKEVEAVRDYIAANNLQEVDKIRRDDQASYRYVNDHFVIQPSRDGDYLVEFVSVCRELRQRFNNSMTDLRNDTSWLRARFDTIRGCRIATFYAINEGQRLEILELGDAPGDEVFLPEDEEEDEDE